MVARVSVSVRLLGRYCVVTGVSVSMKVCFETALRGCKGLSQVAETVLRGFKGLDETILRGLQGS